MWRCCLLLAACATAPVSPSAVTRSGQAPVPIVFDYDRSAPLGWGEEGTGTRGGATVRKGSYVSPRGGRAPAIIVEPVVAGSRRAGVVFVHWGEGNRTEFLPDAIALADRSVVSVLL